MRPEQTAESFWKQVLVGGPDDCWAWKGSSTNGYGRVRWGGKLYIASRVAFSLAKDEIALAAPTDRKAHGFVLHSCDARICCNPAHLFLGSQQENSDDKMAKKRGRWPGRKVRNAI